jgi:hypothetical protein
VTTPFEPNAGAVLVYAEVWGPVGSYILQLALDTGATRTVISHAPLVSLGYDPAATNNRVQVTMGGTVEFSPVVWIDRLDALGKSAQSLDIFAHTLPPSAGIDGVLGLDFLRGRKLTVDFVAGTIDLA